MVASLPGVKTIRAPNQPQPVAISEGVDSIGADVVHHEGIRGENVSVGVIDLGFNLSQPSISDNIVGNRSFTGDISPTGKTRHGTAVSDVIVDTAPNASLYVANVDSMVGFANAVSWFQEHDVDVISTSLAWYSAPFDGTSLVSRAATQAAQSGTVFVSSAGNSAKGHWMGSYVSSDGDRWAEFNGSIEANYLHQGDYIPAGTTVSLYLTWNDWQSPSSDYDLYLYRQGSSVTEWTARSAQRQTVGMPPVEIITTQIPTSGRYYVAVRNHDATGTDNLELFSVDDHLQYSNPNSSLPAPAVAQNVTTVGAFYYSSGELESFSSHGPSNDGRRAIDIVGPDGVSSPVYPYGFYGTSAATPHVAGVAALLFATNPTLSASKTEQILTQTATDMASSGPDLRTGYGRVQAAEAVNKSTPNIHVTTVNASAATTPAEKAITITATAENTGLVAGNATVSLSVDGIPVKNQSVKISGNATQQLHFTHAFEAVGAHSVTVGDHSPMSIQVPSRIHFANQSVSNTSSVVSLAYVNSTQSYFVELMNSTSGSVYGRSNTFEAGTVQKDLAIPLTRNISSGKSLSAVIRSNATGQALGSDAATISVSESTTSDSEGAGVDVADLLSAIEDYRSGRMSVTELLQVVQEFRATP